MRIFILKFELFSHLQLLLPVLLEYLQLLEALCLSWVYLALADVVLDRLVNCDGCLRQALDLAEFDGVHDVQELEGQVFVLICKIVIYKRYTINQEILHCTLL